MSVNVLSRSHVALLLLAVASGCSSQDPAENTRKVTGALSAESLNGLAVPGVVAQDGNGNTFDGPVSNDGTFSLTLPTGPSYRLFITDRRPSGQQSTESSVLWPGRQTWVAVAPGSTDDGAPIDVGSVKPDLDDSGVGGAGTSGGQAANGAAGATGDGASTGAVGSGSGSGSGKHGTTGDGAKDDGESSHGGASPDGSASSDGKSGKGGGPSLCAPPSVKTSVCTGGKSASSVAASGCEADLPYDAKLPVGATYFLEQSFWEKGPSPAKILSVTVEGGHRQAELASNTPFVVTAEDCAHVGNKDVGRDRIFVTWQNANGSTETDHLDMRYCKDGGAWNPGPPKKIPDSCLAPSGGSSAPAGAPSNIPACAADDLAR